MLETKNKSHVVCSSSWRRMCERTCIIIEEWNRMSTRWFTWNIIVFFVLWRLIYIHLNARFCTEILLMAKCILLALSHLQLRNHIILLGIKHYVCLTAKENPKFSPFMYVSRLKKKSFRFFFFLFGSQTYCTLLWVVVLQSLGKLIKMSFTRMWAGPHGPRAIQHFSLKKLMNH